MPKVNQDAIDLSKKGGDASKSLHKIIGNTFQSKRKQTNRRIMDKVEALDRYHKGYKQCDIAKLYDIPESTLRGWIKSEEIIRAKAEKELSSSPTHSAGSSDIVQIDEQPVQLPDEVLQPFNLTWSSFNAWVEERRADIRNGFEKLDYKSMEILYNLLVIQLQINDSIIARIDVLDAGIKAALEKDSELKEELINISNNLDFYKCFLSLLSNEISNLLSWYKEQKKKALSKILGLNNVEE